MLCQTAFLYSLAPDGLPRRLTVIQQILKHCKYKFRGSTVGNIKYIQVKLEWPTICTLRSLSKILFLLRHFLQVRINGSASVLVIQKKDSFNPFTCTVLPGLKVSIFMIAFQFGDAYHR